MRARILAILTAGCVAAAVAGCGGDEPADDYPAAAKRNFTTACERSSGGDRTGCACALGKIQEKLSYTAFKREDGAIRAGRRPSPVITDAIAACVK